MTSFRPGDTYIIVFTTRNPQTLAAQNADSTPVVTANHNGSDDATFTFVVTNLSTGRYKAVGTVPAGYAGGDVVNITAAATVATVSDVELLDVFQIDRTVELPSPAPTGYGPGAGAGTTAVTDLTGGNNRSPAVMTVQTSGGAPIPGATVTAYNAAAYASNPGGAQVLGDTTTDTNGHWTLNLTTGTGAVTLVVAYPGDQIAVVTSAFTV